MSKPAAPAAADAPKKSKKMLIIIIAAVVLLGGGGAAAFLLMKPAHPPKTAAAAQAAEEAPAEEAHPHAEPKYVELGTFTSNLIHEEGDRYLQAAISLKLTKPELEEKIKARNPEILHRINMLLQSKAPSELSTEKGKEKLASDIKAQVEYVMGFRKTPPVIAPYVPPSTEHAATEANVEHPHAKTEGEGDGHGGENSHDKNGIAEVLFTSFIIQ